MDVAVTDSAVAIAAMAEIGGDVFEIDAQQRWRDLRCSRNASADGAANDQKGTNTTGRERFRLVCERTGKALRYVPQKSTTL